MKTFLEIWAEMTLAEKLRGFLGTAAFLIFFTLFWVATPA